MFYENLRSTAGKFAHSTVCGNTYVLPTYTTYTVVYLRCIYRVFTLFISYCMMYGVFSDSESTDSDEYERVLERFSSKG